MSYKIISVLVFERNTYFYGITTHHNHNDFRFGMRFNHNGYV